MTLEIVRLPALSDNYVWLLREPRSGMVGVVDPADPAPVRAALAEPLETLAGTD